MRAAHLFLAMTLEALTFGQGFQRRYDRWQHLRPQTGWGIEQTVDGFMLFSVSDELDSISPDSGIYYAANVLVKIDASGDTIWSRKHSLYGYGIYMGWANCCDTVSGTGPGFVIGGGREAWDGSDEIYLMRLDELGDTLWTRAFGSPGDYWIGYQARTLTTAEFLVAGVTDANGSDDGFILKTDNSGNEIWRQTYGYSATLLDGFLAVDEGPAHTYFCSGTSETTPLNGDHYVARIDSSGALIWQTRWGGPFSEGATQVITLNDGQPLIASGNSYAAGAGSMRPYLAKLDSSDGSFIWQHEYGANTYSTTLFAAKESPNGDLIACGVSYAGGNQQGLLLRTTSEGDSIWLRTYYYQDTLMSDGTGRFYDVLPTSDGGFIAAGAAYHSATLGYPAGYSQDTWVVKVDSMGCIVPGCNGVGVSEIVTNLTNAISIFPNPAHGSLVVQVDLPLPWRNDLALWIKVVNAQGQVVAEQHAEQGDNTLDLSAFSAGLYFVHLSAGSTWLSGAKLIVE